MRVRAFFPCLLLAPIRLTTMILYNSRPFIRFIVESVFDLQNTLRSKHSDLLVACGDPASALAQIVKRVRDAGDEVEGIQLAKEVRPSVRPFIRATPHLDSHSHIPSIQYTSEELHTERQLHHTLSSLPAFPSLKLQFFHTKTLMHPDDLPFDSINDCPDGYTAFRKVVEGLGDGMVRPCIDSEGEGEGEELLPFPEDLMNDDTLDQSSALAQLLAPFPSPPSSSTLFAGGESPALARLSHYIPLSPNAPIATYKQTRNGLLGQDYSSKFSPWLACGALSPRKIWEALDGWDERNTEKGRGTKDSYVPFFF